MSWVFFLKRASWLTVGMIAGCSIEVAPRPAVDGMARDASPETDGAVQADGRVPDAVRLADAGADDASDVGPPEAGLGHDAARVDIGSEVDGAVDAGDAGPQPCVGPACCEPGTVRMCYSGPAGTDAVGECQAGVEVCPPAGVFPDELDCIGEIVPAVERCDTPLDENCDGAGGCTPGDTPTPRIFGDDRNDDLRGVATDSRGNLIVAGIGSSAALQWGTGPADSEAFCQRRCDREEEGPEGDVVVAKLSPVLECIWCQRFSTPAPDAPLGVAVTADDDVVLVGYSAATDGLGCGIEHPDDGDASSNGFVLKVSGEDGACIWGQAIWGAGSQVARSVAVTGGGDVVVVGEFSAALEVAGFDRVTGRGEGAPQDLFVAVLDGADGRPLRRQTFGGDGEESAVAVATSRAGAANESIYIGGQFIGRVDFAQDGECSESAGYRSGYLLKLDAHTLSPTNCRQWGTVRDGFVRALTTDGRGALIAVGQFAGSERFGRPDALMAGELDGFAVGLDEDSFATQWIWRVGDQEGAPLNQALSAVAVDANANVVVAGMVDDEGAQTRTGFVVKLTPHPRNFCRDNVPGDDPAIRRCWWVDVPGSQGVHFDGQAGLAVDRWGRVAAVGFFQGELRVARPPQTARGGDLDFDGFLLRLAP